MLRTLLFSLLLLLSGSNAFATEPQTVILDVPGMTCKFCPITVRKALRKVPGVIEATSDFDTKTATVTFDPDKTGIAELTKATANAGYTSRARQKQ